MRPLALGLVIGTLWAAGCTTEDEEVEVLGKGDGWSSGFLGTYPVTTPISIRDIAAVEAVGPALIELRAAGSSPGTAILNAIEVGDLGLLSTVVRSLSSDLRARLAQRIDVLLDPVKYDIVALARNLEELVARVDIDSDIRIFERGRITGITKEAHQIKRLTFTLNSTRVAVTVPNVIDEGHGYISREGAASLDDVDLVLPLGAMVLAVANTAVFPRFNTTSLAATLEKLIPCDRVGAEINAYTSIIDGTAKCHEALQSLENKIRSALMVEIEVRDGKASIRDGVLTNGSWNWTLEFESFELELPLTFEARARD